MKTTLLLLMLSLLVGCDEKKPLTADQNKQEEQTEERKAFLLEELRKAAADAQYCYLKSHDPSATPGDGVDYERALNALDAARSAAKGLPGAGEAETKGRNYGSELYKMR